MKEQISSTKEETADAFAVVVCDLNGLKVINDTLGHKAGTAHITKDKHSRRIV